MIQLEGPHTIDSIDHSTEIVRSTIKWTRNTTVVPPTYGNAQEVEKAGATKLMWEVEFLSSQAASSVFKTLLDAIQTDTAEVEVVAKFGAGATAADNPEYTFTVAVVGTEAGGNVGDQYRFTYTYPITSTIAIAVAP